MAEFKYLDIDCAAWVRDTYHLRPVARGIYMDLIMLAWSLPHCRLPSDLEWLAERLVYQPDEIPIMVKVIDEFWRLDRHGRWLHQGRLDKEWKASTLRRKQSFVSANARWNKGKKALSNASTVTVTGTALVNPLKRGLSNAVPRGSRARVAGGAARAPAQKQEPAPWAHPEAQAMFDRQIAQAKADGALIEPNSTEEEPPNGKTKH